MKSWTIQHFLADFQTVLTDCSRSCSRKCGLAPWSPPFTPEASLRPRTRVYQRLHRTRLPEIPFLQSLSFQLRLLWEAQTHRYSRPLHLCNTYSFAWIWFWRRHSCLEMTWETFCKGFTNAELYDYRFVKLLTSATLTTWFSYALILERNLSFVTNILACKNII